MKRNAQEEENICKCTVTSIEIILEVEYALYRIQTPENFGQRLADQPARVPTENSQQQVVFLKRQSKDVDSCYMDRDNGERSARGRGEERSGRIVDGWFRLGDTGPNAVHERVQSAFIFRGKDERRTLDDFE